MAIRTEDERMTNMEWKEHKEIWLQPWCVDCSRTGDDRMWCEDDVWGKCEECGRKPPRFILAETDQ